MYWKGKNMGVTIFFMIISVAVIIGTAVYVKRNNKLYNFKNNNKNTSSKKQKKNIKNIWGIDMIENGIISVQGQYSIIVEIGGIEYRLLNEKEQENIDISLTKICRTMSYKMQLFSTIVKVDTNEKIYEIRENMKKQKNSKMIEYGEAIIEYLEELMQEDNLYVRKNYLIFSSLESQVEAEKNLIDFYESLKYGLNKIRISCNRLNDEGIIELIHRELNKNSTEKIEKIIKEGGLDIYVKGKEGKRKETVNKE